MNGSSATGHCSNTTIDESSNRLTCAEPASSVLFDGNIPTLTGLDGDMWASQLQTTEMASVAFMNFDFSDTPGFTLVRTVEW